MIKYYPRDFRNDGSCASGIKKWSKVNNICFREFSKNGLTEEQIKETKDAYAIKILQKIKAGNNG